ncbi:MAG: cob(I)yrinic acid a,c-diamide adenosyltransferase [Puniceicoccaceae bacterium]
MTIVTKKGDGGHTSLRYGRPVSKTDARVEAYGTVDELGSALGFAKALLREEPKTTGYGELLHTVQSQLLSVGADLATTAEDHASRNKAQFNPAFLDWLDAEIAKLEKIVKMNGFVLPGANPPSGYVHLARTVARRAEREVLRLLQVEECEQVRSMLPYLNRLSDFLWLLGERLAQS